MYKCILIGLACLSMIANAQTALDIYITDQMENKHIPGVSAVIIKDEKLAWVGNYGVANLSTGQAVDTNTLFMLASISKTITATAIMQLYEDGYFELTDDINLHLPFEIYHPSYPDSTITMLQLLTHSAAMRDNWNILDTVYVAGDSPLPLGDFMQGYFEVGGPYYYAEDNFYTYAPGADYNYCNEGIALLGYMVEVFTGQPFNSYCNEHIIEPLCMTNTGWFLSELDTNLIAHPYDYISGSYYDYGLYGYPDYPDGQLRTTSLSLAKFLWMNMYNGNFNGVQLLQPETIELIRASQIPFIDPTQGLVWYSYEDGGTWWGHSGGDSGVSTDMYFNEDTQTGIIVLTNSDNSHTQIWNELVDFAATLNTENSPAITCNSELPLNVITSNQTHLTLFPNPASSYLYIETTENFDNYAIISAEGKLQLSGKLFSNKIELNNLSSGLYYLKIRNLQGEIIGVSSFVKL
ncbi:MAG TPA: serine hydrolase [Chitinophagales bacterium]|nr:serine hydrolase [Chitinophagales bacterium]